MANANLDFSGLSVTRTFTFPDATGTIALTTGSSSIVTVGTITTGVWHGTKIGLLYGGTNADLSGTGGAHQFLRQNSSGATIDVVQPALADLSDAATIALLASPTFTGTPLAPTAALGTDTTQIATTDFVLANTGTVSPSPSAPSTGATETYAVNGPITTGIIAPLGTLAALTVVLGDGTLGGQTFWLVSTHIITALTLTGTFNAEGLADPTTLLAGSTTVWQWDAADAGGTLGWARIL